MEFFNGKQTKILQSLIVSNDTEGNNTRSIVEGTFIIGPTLCTFNHTSELEEVSHLSQNWLSFFLEVEKVVLSALKKTMVVRDVFTCSPKFGY